MELGFFDLIALKPFKDKRRWLVNNDKCTHFPFLLFRVAPRQCVRQEASAFINVPFKSLKLTRGGEEKVVVSRILQNVRFQFLFRSILLLIIIFLNKT